MASEKGAFVSGLDSETQATRRRNVPSTSPNGGMVDRIEVDEKKIQRKKVSSDFSQSCRVRFGHC